MNPLFDLLPLKLCSKSEECQCEEKHVFESAIARVRVGDDGIAIGLYRSSGG